MAIGIGGLLLSAALVAIAAGWSVPASSATVPAVKVHIENAHLVTRSSHIPLGNCPAKDVTMRASISGLRYSLSQPINVIAVIRNSGSRACTYVGGGTEIYFGPCGSFPMEVFNKVGVSVWPGPISPSCPMFSQKELPAGGQVIASGTWPQTIGFREGSPAAPPGRYRLVVEKTISFTIVLK